MRKAIAEQSKKDFLHKMAIALKEAREAAQFVGHYLSETPYV